MPVGGGGLIGGIGAYVKERYPEVRIVGVEPFESASMAKSLYAGEPVTLDHVGTFADGVAVRRVGDEAFRLAREVVDEVVLVSTDEICAAIKDIFEDSRVVVEPAGALGVAGLKRWLEQNPARGKTLIAINSGANLSFGRLRHVTERAEIGEHREALIAAEIPERRGAFLAFCEALGLAHVTEFNYRYAAGATARSSSACRSHGRGEKRARCSRRSQRHGYPVLDLSDNEVAKLHVRHMVGGRVPGLADEHLYRFEFPERPGALLAFLKAIGQRWNISLFHYRNHGSDYGRVLAGVQVPPAERADFASHLAALGYAYWEETDNPAYRLFLGAPDRVTRGASRQSIKPPARTRGARLISPRRCARSSRSAKAGRSGAARACGLARARRSRSRARADGNTFPPSGSRAGNDRARRRRAARRAAASRTASDAARAAAAL